MFAVGLGLGIASRNAATGAVPGAAWEAAVAALGPDALYSFADPASLFVGRNGAGGSPAVDGTASIGLVLDRAAMGGRPLAAFLAGRPELVANGGFTADTAGWTAFNGAIISAEGGRLRVQRKNTTSSPLARQTLTGLTVGRLYRVSVTVAGFGGTTVASVIAQGLATLSVAQPGGPVSLLFVATATTQNIHLGIQGSSGAIDSFVEFDHASVKEIPGNHLTAPTDAARPLLVAEGGRLLARFDGVDDTLELAGLDRPGAYLALALRTGDTVGVVASGDRASGQTAPFYAAWQGGNTTGTITDDVVVGGTLALARTDPRDSLAAALGGGTAEVVELVASDFGGLTRWRLLNFPSNTSFNVAADVSGAVLFASAPAAADRAIVRGWLAGLSGATVAEPVVYDAYVDAVSGDDANPGTSDRPIATLDRLTALAGAAPEGSPQRYLIRAGTYTKAGDGQSFKVMAGTFELTFEPGCTMVCQAGLASGPRGIDCQGTSRVTVHGNGLTITDYDGFNGGSWANGISGNHEAVITAYDITIVNAGDGISLHESCVGHFERLHISGSRKGNFAHVSTTRSTHVDCTFVARPDGENGIGNVSVHTLSADFLRCTFVPVSPGQVLTFNNATVRECTIGTLALFATLVLRGTTVTDTFVHARMNLDAGSGGAVRRCFGHLALAHRAGGTGFLVENSVFARIPSTTLAPGFLYLGPPPASGSPVTIRDTVLAGFDTAIGQGVDAASAQQLVDAGLSLENVAWWNNAADIDPDLLAAAGFVPPAGAITADPRLGARDTTARGAWGLLAGSPCFGAGTGGGDIGFRA